MKVLKTKRLVLRTWQESDVSKMYEINQDLKVMEYFPSLKSLEETERFIEGAKKHLKTHGYTLYAVDVKGGESGIGFIGLSIADFKAHFTPATEIGWRLSSKHWGQGLATEGAKAVLKYAFNKLYLSEVVTFTAEQNRRSRRVMEKIGLQHETSDDFDHPSLNEDSPLRRHVLYRLSQPSYLARQ